MSELLLDATGRRRSPATLPEFHAGRPPRNKGTRYPADPPTIEEIVAVMRRVGDSVHGRRLRGLIVELWRAGLRICEALALADGDAAVVRSAFLGCRHGRVGWGRWGLGRHAVARVLPDERRRLRRRERRGAFRLQLGQPL